MGNRDVHVTGVALHVFVPRDGAYLQLASGETNDDVRLCGHLDQRMKVVMWSVFDFHVRVAAIDRDVGPGVPDCAAQGDADVIVCTGLDLIGAPIEIKINRSTRHESFISAGWRLCGCGLRCRTLRLAARGHSKGDCHDDDPE